MKKICLFICLILVPSLALAQRYAFVSNGDVVKIIETDSPSKNHGPAVVEKMFPCASQVVKGWHYDGLTFTPPTAEEVAKQEAADLREARFTSLIDQIDKFLDVLEGNGTIDANDVEVIQAAGQ